jgi:hypothetical protein
VGIPLVLDTPVRGNPGDEFSFACNTNNTQYHIQVDGVGPGVIIGVWGPNNPSLGKARNQAGKTYVDRTLTAGSWRITVQDAQGPYTIVVTANSWWKKVFGW